MRETSEDFGEQDEDTEIRIFRCTQSVKLMGSIDTEGVCRKTS